MHEASLLLGATKEKVLKINTDSVVRTWSALPRVRGRRSPALLHLVFLFFGFDLTGKLF